MNMFEEIEKKEEQLKTNDIKNQAKKITKKYNLYQIVAFVIAAIGLIAGIVSGSINSQSKCITEQVTANNYNTNIMLIIWCITFLIAVCFYWMGEIVELLKIIKENSSKPNKSK